MDESEQVRKAMRIGWPVDAGPVNFANNATVQADEEGVIYITFFQANPPIMVGDKAAVELALDALESIKAIPISRLAIPRGVAAKLVKILNRHTQVFDDTDTRTGTEAEDDNA